MSAPAGHEAGREGADEGFDPAFYRAHYPDIVAAGLDPWRHYDAWGRREGRLPRRLRALVAERDAWMGLAGGLRALDRLAADPDPLERGWARWARLRLALETGERAAAAAAAAGLWADRPARARLRGPGAALAALDALAPPDGGDGGDEGGDDGGHEGGDGGGGDGGATGPRVAALVRLMARRAAARAGTPAEPAARAEAALARYLAGLRGGATAEALWPALAAGLWAPSGLEQPGLVPAPGPGQPFDRPGLAPASGPGQPFDRLAGPLAGAAARRFGRWPGGARTDPSAPLVSVVMPARDAAATLATALAGLCAQSWRALEILVVDDASRDATPALVRRLAAADPRIRLLRGTGEGAYVARNLGLAAARGAFVTVHDADDWSHPGKIAAQVAALLAAPDLPACLSHLVRMRPDLSPVRIPWELGGGLAQPNLSSLMFRTPLRERLGYWDRVRAGADSEFLDRLRRAFGPAAVAEVHPGVPLSLVRSHEASLTRRPATHLRTALSGPRAEYMAAAARWQAGRVAGLGAGLGAGGGLEAGAARAAALHLPQHPPRRPFRAPPALALAQDRPAPADAVAIVADSPLFDARWYLAHNSDVRADGIDPALHYVRSGAAQGRDPGPAFSTTGYRAAGAPGFANPLVHYETAGRIAGRAALPRLPGALAGVEGPRVLVCGHLAGPELYGAERSLPDMLARLVAAGKVPVVVIPRGDNPAYLAALRARAAAVVVMPLPWWHVDRPPHRATLAALEGLIATHRATEVHANTAVLQAPRLAGRAAGVPVVVHLREMPGADGAIRAAILGSVADREPPPPEAAVAIRAALLAEADRFVANSAAVAAWIDAPGRVEVVGNRVDPGLFGLPAAPVSAPGAGLCLGMISSNIAKKGIAEAVAVAEAAAQALAGRGGAVRLRLVGPASADLAALGPLPAMVEAPGYAAGPAGALAGIDVVLSLSRVPESFGRTVLEAMAAGRPVIAWDRGHPPALIGRGAGAGGIVVPADDIAAAAAAVAALAGDRARLAALGTAARARARALLAGEGAACP